MTMIEQLRESDTSKITRDQLIGLIDTMRIDVILGESNEFDQDELGAILAILTNDNDIKDIYGIR